MSQENVELCYRRFEESRGRREGRPRDRGTRTGVLTATRWLSLSRVTYQGQGGDHEAVSSDLVSDFSDFHSTNVEVIAEADDWVVVAFRWHTRGAQSGIAGTWEMTAVVQGSSDGRFIEAHFAGNGSRPSKPPGCGSRRCRRRTWRSCGPQSQRGTRGTWTAFVS